MKTITISRHGLTIDGAYAGHTPKQTLLMELLFLRRGWVSTDDMMDYIYQDAPNQPFADVIAQFLYNVRHHLKKFGVEIENNYQRAYRIVTPCRVVLKK